MKEAKVTTTTPDDYPPTFGAWCDYLRELRQLVNKIKASGYEQLSSLCP